jgi:chemotaxis protein MotB
MGKKHKHPEHENLERWLVSYADFITLLFATFTALYAIATADLAKASKAQATAQAITQSFQDQSLMAGIKSIIKGKSDPNNNPNPLSKKHGEGPGILGKHDSLVPRQGEVRSKMPTQESLNTLVQAINQQLQATAGVTLSIESAGIRISFNSALLYDSGSAQLKPVAQKALALLTPQLKTLAQQHSMLIEGHTDNQPMHSSQYPTNWELSAARACAVVRYGVTHGLPANRLSAVGFGDTRPRVSNATDAGRSKNRRIDIVVQGFKPEPTAVKVSLKPVEPVLPSSQTVAASSRHNNPAAIPLATHTANAAKQAEPLSNQHAPHQANMPKVPITPVHTTVVPTNNNPHVKNFVPPRFEQILPVTTTKTMPIESSVWQSRHDDNEEKRHQL